MTEFQQPLAGHAATRRAPLGAMLLALCLTAAPAVAQQDLYQDDWAFNLFNDSSMALRSFQTADKNGVFGHNWLEQPMSPGIGLTLEFSDPLDTRCEQPVRIAYTNGATINNVVNFCGIAILRVTDSGFFVE